MLKKGPPAQRQSPLKKQPTSYSHKHQRSQSTFNVSQEIRTQGDLNNRTLNMSPVQESRSLSNTSPTPDSYPSMKSITKPSQQYIKQPSEIMKRMLNRKGSGDSLGDSGSKSDWSINKSFGKNEKEREPVHEPRVVKYQPSREREQTYGNTTAQMIENMPPVKYTHFVEVVGQLREVIHKLQRQDAVQRQELLKTKKLNETLKIKVRDLTEKVTELENARQRDVQYLIKLDNYLLNEKRHKSGHRSSKAPETSDRKREKSQSAKRTGKEKGSVSGSGNGAFRSPIVSREQSNREEILQSPSMFSNQSEYSPERQKSSRKIPYMARSDMQAFPIQEENINPFQWTPNQSIQNEFPDLQEEEIENNGPKIVTMSDIDVSEESPYAEPSFKEYPVSLNQTVEVSELLKKRNSMANQDYFQKEQLLGTGFQQVSQSLPYSPLGVPEREIDISDLRNTAPVFAGSQRINSQNLNAKPSLSSFEQSQKVLLNQFNPLGLQEGVRNNVSSSRTTPANTQYNEKDNLKSGGKNNSLGHQANETKQQVLRNEIVNNPHFQNISPAALEILDQFHEHVPSNTIKKAKHGEGHRQDKQQKDNRQQEDIYEPRVFSLSELNNDEEELQDEQASLAEPYDDDPQFKQYPDQTKYRWSGERNMKAWPGGDIQETFMTSEWPSVSSHDQKNI